MYDTAKRYSSIKYALAILDTVYLLALLLLFAGLGASKILSAGISKIAVSWLITSLYLLIVLAAYYLLNFPITFYGSYILERKFNLSTQKFKGWFLDQLKSLIISYIIGLLLVFAFYYIFEHNRNNWWLTISVFWIFFSLVLAKLVPIIIIPLFFKYKRLSDDTLRARIMNLADKMKIKILDCFEINFSKKTLKANAAFVGWGATKRVILADTLRDKYTDDEIEVILAHEFAHYKLRHLLKLILLNSFVTIICFYLIFKTSAYALTLFGLSSLADIASLPVIIIYFVLFSIITSPFANFISRRLERNADILALKITCLKEAFISMMDKLAHQNLADRKPHPIIKFFFFDHPPIEERINAARNNYLGNQR